jgi:CheY-like chemotaxis protein
MQVEKISEFLSRYTSDNEIYHDLMQFKVAEILLVATMYDAFILEQEGKLTELIFGEYLRLNLSQPPRVTNVSFGEQALQMLASRRFDMVILTMRIDEMTPFDLSRRIREVNATIPILLLLKDDSDIELVKRRPDRLRHLDKIFVWNGDPKIFVSMIKYIEDRMNVDNDAAIGLVRVILLVEDSIRYCSRYLPLLHVEIMKQTQRLIADERLDEMKKLLRMRTRPKVLMAETYEEALELFNKYRDNLLCVISDVRFSRNGELNDEAGVKLIRYIKSKTEFLPILLQSAEEENAGIAAALKVSFLNKNSARLSRDLTEFIFNYLGFGNFVFRNSVGKEIAAARSMAEFEKLLHTVPDESLVFHADRNHFSSWVMARGEIQIAKFMQPIRVSDFDSVDELRSHLIEVCKAVHKQETVGKLVPFAESTMHEWRNVVRLSGGSVGGKGRGMLFLNKLIQDYRLFTMNPGANILIPETAVIGTDEYERFIKAGDFDKAAGGETDYEVVKRLSLKGKLSVRLRGRLRKYLQRVRCPLAVRSSSQFEDSLSQPFSGIYDTYFLPNSHADIDVRLRHLEQAIKLIYASVYSASARSYFESIDYTIGEERMGILIQNAVGNSFAGRFYPHVSGVAQSYNFYPVSYLQPGDGIALLGFGLGKYVVDGEKAWRFCPKHPRMDFIAQDDLLRETQTEFYALDMEEKDLDLSQGSTVTLARLGISEAEGDDTLRHCTSVWDEQSGSISTGSESRGPRIVNFADLLKHDYFPIAQLLDALLGIIKGSMGTPVKIEFAIDLKEHENGKPSLYLLQVKPLLGNLDDFSFDTADIDRKDLLLYSARAMGNGVISDINDIVYADPRAFDRGKTVEMARELEKLNDAMKREGRRYVLIGPGRWGSRDPWLGIPVRWPQISNARIIVETDIPEFRVDSSLGSHFFHNITSKNIGYFHIPLGSTEEFIDWEWLEMQPIVGRTEHFVHIRTEEPLVAKMDGRKSISVIFKRPG